MVRILKRSRYNPGRGGHAPGDLRNAFEEAVEALDKHQIGCLMPVVEVREHEVPIDVPFRLLWNCPDILPRLLADQVNDLLWSRARTNLKRRTYGAASRLLLTHC